MHATRHSSCQPAPAILAQMQTTRHSSCQPAHLSERGQAVGHHASQVQQRSRAQLRQQRVVLQGGREGRAWVTGVLCWRLWRRSSEGANRGQLAGCAGGGRAAGAGRRWVSSGGRQAACSKRVPGGTHPPAPLQTWPTGGRWRRLAHSGSSPCGCTLQAQGGWLEGMSKSSSGRTCVLAGLQGGAGARWRKRSRELRMQSPRSAAHARIAAQPAAHRRRAAASAGAP